LDSLDNGDNALVTPYTNLTNPHEEKKELLYEFGNSLMERKI
jgi:hypothetical protein